MTAETVQNTTKTFKFSFPTCTNEDLLFKLEVPVEIPHSGSTRELVQRVINMFHIPVYLEDELNEKLAEFVTEETKNFHNDRDEKLLNQLKNSELNVEGIVKNWEKMFKDNVMEFAEQKGTSDEEVFAAAYHKLVHSPALETILQVENSYAKTVMNTVKNRDEDIKVLTQSQTEEMEEKVRLLNLSTTEEEINELAAEHFEQQSLAAGRWGSQLDALAQAQRAHYRAWLMRTLEQYQHSAQLHTPTTSIVRNCTRPRELISNYLSNQSLVTGRWGSQLDALAQAQRAHYRAWLMRTLEQYQHSAQLHTPTNSPLGTFSPPLAAEGGAPRPRLEESFTIHLGSQLKQTHNVRIVAMDMRDLCTLDHVDNPLESSRRLQTSLGLYSTELSACVLISDRVPPDALPAAAAATEHHFPSVDAQLREIAERIKEPLRGIAESIKEPMGFTVGCCYLTARHSLPSPLEASQQLQTSLGLYSTELSACVLISDRVPPDALPAAAAATEHHFPSVDAQLREIAERIKEPHHFPSVVHLEITERIKEPVNFYNRSSRHSLPSPLEASQRLQTSLGLYSTELSACVLISDRVPPDALPAAAAATEHHFPSVDAQLREIAERIKEPAEARNAQRLREQQSNGNTVGTASKARWRQAMQPGDALVTRHSNLADVHVVFHLLADDAPLRTGDITSRHPAILGLRNILKAACCNDVTSISIPLLLRNDLSEETTAAWCLRRAELVLKCVKGFVLEAAGWGGAEPRTLHFCAPPATAPELFHALANLLPTIFRISNPVKVKPPAS
ncbi:protein C12orf4 homolog [Ostrinia nubilalis]|uniref:protein C12orf4 homolog n=1 Tax=Ostrinia nubilalis TaxID=29057 RepID=UPI0030823358